MKTAHKTLKLEPALVTRIEEWCNDNDRSFNWFMGKAAELKLEAVNAGVPKLPSAPAGANAAESGGKSRPPPPARKCRGGKHCAIPKAVNS